jgi:hypothetical protein
MSDGLLLVRLAADSATELGDSEQEGEVSLERARRSVLNLRGKRKTDAPGTEWFITTSDEISGLIRMVLG